MVRFQLLALATAALAGLLLWGSWLVLGAGIGTQICAHYTYTIGGTNQSLSSWCNGNSWRGWLGDWLLAALGAFLAGTALAAKTLRARWLLLGTAIAATAIWVGFALPQTLAGSDTSTTSQAQPSTTTPTPPPARVTPTPSARLRATG